MKAGLAVLAAVLTVLSLGTTAADAAITDPGAPHYANSMFSNFVTPTVAPGGTVNFAFNLTNPYAENMSNVILTVGVYEYATQDEARLINASFKNPPLINGTSVEKNIVIPLLSGDPGKNSKRFELSITTTKDTPHGSYFSQSTYFVRFKLVFQFEGDNTEYLLQSKGFFTADQWSKMVSFKAGQEIVDISFMNGLGVDGIIPDSSFGIKVPIPRWPLAVLVVACVLVTLVALYYFVLDNPGKYPRLEKRAYYLRGKLSQLRGHPKNRT